MDEVSRKLCSKYWYPSGITVSQQTRETWQSYKPNIEVDVCHPGRGIWKVRVMVGVFEEDSKTFSRASDAEDWISQTVARMLRGEAK